MPPTARQLRQLPTIEAIYRGQYFADIALVTSLVLILIGGKPIINSNIGPYRIGSTNNLPYRRCLDIYTL